MKSGSTPGRLTTAGRNPMPLAAFDGPHALDSRGPPLYLTRMQLVVNGIRRDVHPEPTETLAVTLRERLHLTGTKVACGRGECGTCTVLLDGEPVYACLTLTRGIDGAPVTTIEGIGTTTELHPVQRAFTEHDAVQCGFCTPGQVLAAIALLSRTNGAEPDEESIRRGMSGNLCRCGTYPRIVAAIRAAWREMASQGETGETGETEDSGAMGERRGGA